MILSYNKSKYELTAREHYSMHGFNLLPDLLSSKAPRSSKGCLKPFLDSRIRRTFLRKVEPHPWRVPFERGCLSRRKAAGRVPSTFSRHLRRSSGVSGHPAARCGAASAPSSSVFAGLVQDPPSPFLLHGPLFCPPSESKSLFLSRHIPPPLATPFPSRTCCSCGVPCNHINVRASASRHRRSLAHASG